MLTILCIIYKASFHGLTTRMVPMDTYRHKNTNTFDKGTRFVNVNLIYIDMPNYCVVVIFS